jgi:3-methyladenine DNA glycosylase AlkD
MPGKLDEISRVIGSLERSIAEIQRRMEEQCRLQETHHKDNTEKLSNLEKLYSKLSSAVERMTPTVGKLELSHAKMARWAAISFSIVVMLAWTAEAAVRWAVGWALDHLK